jgi:uncharacterized Fe-S radical SAM superfamily protein PflX
MTTRSASANNHQCPLCERRVKNDRARRGFCAHLKRPNAERLLGEPGKRAMMTSADVSYLTKTGRCPFERGQRAA